MQTLFTCLSEIAVSKGGIRRLLRKLLRYVYDMMLSRGLSKASKTVVLLQLGAVVWCVNCFSNFSGLQF
jgi:hypothetical protein